MVQASLHFYLRKRTSLRLQTMSAKLGCTESFECCTDAKDTNEGFHYRGNKTVIKQRQDSQSADNNALPTPTPLSNEATLPSNALVEIPSPSLDFGPTSVPIHPPLPLSGVCLLRVI